MPIHLTQFGKHKFVCGLFWQSLSRPRELDREAADLAKKIDADLMVVLRDQANAQAGFVHTRDGATAGSYSLAAAVSKSLTIEGIRINGEIQQMHDWLGAFKLPDGFWMYLAVRDSHFLPNGDFAGTKEEVLERLHGDYGLGGWNAVVGDAELENCGFHNFVAKGLEDLLPRRPNGQLRVHRWWSLRPVEPRLTRKLIFAVAALSVVAVSAGLYAWKQHQLNAQAEELARAIAAAGNQTPPPVVRPWADQPSPRGLSEACERAFDHVSPGGWKLDRYVCSGGQASYTWSRQGATIDFLLEQIPSATVDLNGESASTTLVIQPGPSRDEALLDFKNLVLPLRSRLQLLNLTFTLSHLPVPQTPQPAQPVPWTGYKFTLAQSTLSPSQVGALLDRPGMRLNRIAYENEAWSFEGVLYAK